MTQFLVVIIVLAGLFAILQQFVQIPERIVSIVWIVIAVLVGVWAVRLLVPMLGLG